jgi:pimeloyl-ACP methyl ester carboxylesterase
MISIDAGERQLPLVLIPGHRGTALSWRYQVEALSSNREIIVPDKHYALTSIEDMAQDIATRLPLRFDLVGWSMGGYIAFELYPLVADRLRKLVLINTSARPESLEARARRAEFLRSMEAKGLGAVCADQFEELMVDPNVVDPEFKKRIVADSVELGESTIRSQVEALMSRNDRRPFLKDIHVPVLVIAGHEDPVTPPECSIEIARAIPNATLHILEQVGHCSPWEQSERVNELMRSFLNAE